MHQWEVLSDYFGLVQFIVGFGGLVGEGNIKQIYVSFLMIFALNTHVLTVMQHK